MLCAACNKPIQDTETSLLKCTGCGGTYHFNCLNLSSNQSLEDIKKTAASWKCSFCASVNSRRRRNDFTPVLASVSTATLDDSVMSCDATLDESRLAVDPFGTSNLDSTAGLRTPPNRFNSRDHASSGASSQQAEVLNNILLKISELQIQFSAIQTIQADINQVKSDVTDMKNSLDSRLEEMAGRLDTIESRVSVIENCKTEVDSLKSTVSDIMSDMRRNEQWVRRSNIQINGVPETSGENLYTILNSLASKSGYPLNVATDIDFVTRVAVKDDRNSNMPKPIIVKLQARYKKDDFIASLRKLKNLKASDLGFSNSENRIYINDHLSGYNKYLLREAKRRKTQKEYKWCWVQNCTVMVRKTDNSPILFITSEDALNKIV